MVAQSEQPVLSIVQGNASKKTTVKVLETRT